jgi:NitT/TauT family transport system substrate-binding protein
MADKYSSLGYAEKSLPSWRSVAYPNIIQRTNLEGELYRGESKKEFAPVTDAEGDSREAIATKQVRINFRTAEFQLDENAKYIIDREFVEIAKAFGNARIRIEGNTDNVGNRANNVALSKKRAQSVRDYLVSEHNMDSNRFIVVGNGPDNPVADNSTDAGKAENRRTDFELVRE